MSTEETSNEPAKPKTLTVEMVRKRAEHNDGMLSTLEEVALHQDEIGVITNVFERYTPHLKILYLQNNYIEKIEHITLLHELEYLNLALNNIQVIEGLEGCEKLNKLDLTCNFIVDLVSVQVLEQNIFLRELYLIGNPCDKFQGYREFVIASLPQLTTFDGTEITPSERIAAKRKYSQLLNQIIEQVSKCDTGHYTPEERMKAWQEIEETKKKNKPPEPNGPSFQPPKPPAPPNGPDENGHITQCNTGKWNFKWYQEGTRLCLDTSVPRYLSTSLIDIDVNPTWIRIEAKGKVLQLVLPAEVKSEQVEALRSQASGHLVVKMELEHPNQSPVVQKKN
ncbi:leucine rich repeat protein [Histomonas meleagridis]|uniref:leucine rich repeat protein n=1 Tax=Histomonas meleagridis TaxID=135588 RepID=UPI00355AA71A|nr:leucine rich repeat protein [Histomonas meleagridis]KAH0801028.1 leucine rich repeat protein [Histomonas meleagridis]